MPFPMQTQKQDQWCWAAVTSSVDKYFDPASTWKQCKVAEAALRLSKCCGHSPPHEPCNRSFSLSAALSTVGRAPGLQAGPVSFAVLNAELAAGFPICARVAWDGGGGHFVVVDGCWPDEEWVSVRDPLFVDQAMSYEELKSSYLGMGQWTHSYLVR